MNKDYLSPEHSPNKLTGVKRVNNVPLFIVVGILALFVVAIALVATKRANNQEQKPKVEQVKNPKLNTMSLAQEVVGQHKNAIIPVQEETLNINPEPPAPKEKSPEFEPKPPEVSEAEVERIRQEKTQEFEEAVKSKTSVMVDNQRLNNRETVVRNPEMDSGATFKEQLAVLQGRTAPLALGGEENEMRWHLNSKLRNPNSRFELRTGSVIPGVMISGISSELPGQIISQVSQNIYDTATGKYLIIPQGTKILGIYSSNVGFGQNSVLVAWQRLIYPDGRVLDIGSMPGADSAGFAGFRDQVDHHYARVYGSALLMSGIIAGITYSQNTNQANQFGYAQPTAGSVLSQALGQQLGEVTAQVVSKNLNISPTVNVRPGYRFNIIVVKDLVFKKPYREFAY